MASKYQQQQKGKRSLWTKIIQCLNYRKVQIGWLIGVNVTLLIILVALFAIIYGYVELKLQDEKEQEIMDKALKNSLMLNCHYYVTPWFLNLCFIEDTAEQYAWRQFKILNASDPNCVDVHEIVPCHDESATTKLNVYKVPKHERQILSQFQFAGLLFVRLPNLAYTLEKSTVEVKIPIIDLNEFHVGKIISTKDIFILSPTCLFRGCDGWNFKIINLRQGWPKSFSSCDPSIWKKYNCSATMTTDLSS